MQMHLIRIPDNFKLFDLYKELDFKTEHSNNKALKYIYFNLLFENSEL